MREVRQWFSLTLGLLAATTVNGLANYQVYLYTKGRVPEHYVGCGKFQAPISLEDFYNTTNRFESVQHFLVIELVLLVLALALVAWISLYSRISPGSEL